MSHIKVDPKLENDGARKLDFPEATLLPLFEDLLL